MLHLVMRSADKYTETSEGSNENDQVVDEKAGGKELDRINVSSD